MVAEVLKITNVHQTRNCAGLRGHDEEMYKRRHQIESFLARLSEIRAIAKHCDKTDKSLARKTHLEAGVFVDA